MSLHALQAGLEAEIATVSLLYEELATTRTFSSAADFSLEEECLLEGVLSRIWQSWNRFCRETIFESCLGTQDLSGFIAPHVNATTVGAISNAAIRAKKGARPIWSGTNSMLHLEPTWGDTDVLLDIVTRLAPANAAKLSGGCTLASPGAKVLQVTRNAAAHQNSQTMANLARLSSSYNAFSITHPCQALFWVEPSSGEFLFLQAVEALKDAAMYCAL
jgi:hypothetical protein